MGSEWPESRLDEITTLIIDCPHSTPEWTDSGIVVLRSNNIKGGRLDLSSPSYTNEAGYAARIKRAIPSEGDLVITREAPMGEVCQIPPGLRCCLGQRMVLLRTDPALVDSKYLLFALQSPYLQHQISWSEGTGTTVSNIRIPDLKAFLVPTPAINEQKQIASILGSLDDKIELNRQMNTTLEAMAQALFKSWFVDFDPVIDNALAAGNPIPDELAERAERRAKAARQQSPEYPHTLPAAIRQQFPDRFVLTDTMGWVPEGWELGNLSQVAKLVNKSVQPNSEPSKLWTHFSIPAFDAGLGPAMDLGNTIKSGKYQVPIGSVLVSKLNPQTPRVWLPAVSAESAAICSTEFMPFVPLNSDERTFLYSLFCSGIIQSEINQRVSGSTGSRQRVSPKHIAVLPALMPPREPRLVFSSVLDPIFTKQQENNQQIKELAAVRDTLLPKLLSGQLRIAEAEQLVAEAL